MNAKHIARAIAALDKAATALRSGHLSIPAQIALASECNEVQFWLEYELEKLQVPVKEEACSVKGS